MAKRPAQPKPKLTDAERHKRFVEMAREVAADQSPKALNIAFKRITQGSKIRSAPKRAS